MIDQLVSTRDLQYFAAVVETQSFTSAARTLDVSQSAVSQAVSRLERELDAHLIDRTTHRLQLTASGREVLNEANNIFTRLTDLRAVAAAAESGQPLIRIGSLTSGVSGILPRLLALDTKYSYAVTALPQNGQLEALHNGIIDVGVFRTWREPGLVVKVVHREKLLVALSTRHRLASQERIRLADLRRDPFVLFLRSAAPLAFDTIMTTCQRAGFTPRIQQEERSEQVILGLVAANQGVSIVPEIATSLHIDGLVYKPIDDRAAITPLAVVTTGSDPHGYGRHVAAMLTTVMGSRDKPSGE